MDPHLQQVPGVAIGEVTGATADGRPLVRCHADAAPAAAVVAVLPQTPDWRRSIGMRVALVFLDGDPSRPLVLALLDAPAPAATTPRTLRIAAGEELRIECGKSSIHLRADGRIEIRGEHLVSRSRGPNKVKGGSVHLN
ncbi:MAG: hypothetical protein JNL08_09175 [Planctomycetes bacterium]|nr:hypothetical protein [Planctomycetota bacterium]